jgi:hypothetical protein
MTTQGAMQHSVASTNLADLLERVLDKGIVIAGDIKIKLVDIELLTIQIRLVVCSVEKAKELGLDWWTNGRSLSSACDEGGLADSVSRLEERLAKLEGASS